MKPLCQLRIFLAMTIVTMAGFLAAPTGLPACVWTDTHGRLAIAELTAHNHLWTQDGDRELEAKKERYHAISKEIQKSLEAGKISEEEAAKANMEAMEAIFPDAENRKLDENWIDRNLVLFITLVQLSWIVPTILICWICYVVRQRKEQQRTEALLQAANETGLPLEAEGSEEFHASLPDFPLFEVGRARKLKNLIRADTPDLKISMFDYCFTTGHGKSKKVRRLSVGVVQSTELTAPRCHLRPQIAFWDPIGALLGGQDINFADHPEFSKKFVLKSDEEEQVRRFFDQELLNFFSQHPDLSFESRVGAFLYFRQWKRIEPAAKNLQEFIGEGFALHAAIQERNSRP